VRFFVYEFKSGGLDRFFLRILATNMPETIPQIYQNLSEQERLEADYNLVGFFGLLMKIDQRLKKEQANNLMKDQCNEQRNQKTNC